MKYLIKRFYHAFSGIFIALKGDLSFMLQFWAGLLLICLTVLVTWPLSELEWALLILGWFLILITELQNTALETALDRLHPERHDNIKISKDMAAGAVLLAGIFFLAVVGAIWYTFFIL